jgi:hypothetical protein
VREVIACLSRDDGVLHVRNHSEQLLRPDAAKLSVIDIFAHEKRAKLTVDKRIAASEGSARSRNQAG